MAAGAVLLAAAMPPGIANAAPKGWKCDYADHKIGIGLGSKDYVFNYSCYGKTLRGTRARAVAECRRLAGCL